MKLINPFSKTYLFFILPLILVMGLDLIFTLIGQSQDYWRNFQFFNEANPLAGFLLSHHPALFVLIFSAYLILALFLVVNLKRPLNLIFYIFFFLIHSWGSSSWLSELFFSSRADYSGGWYLSIGYFIFISLISGLSLSFWLKNRNL